MFVVTEYAALSPLVNIIPFTRNNFCSLDETQSHLIGTFTKMSLQMLSNGYYENTG